MLIIGAIQHVKILEGFREADREGSRLIGKFLTNFFTNPTMFPRLQDCPSLFWGIIVETWRSNISISAGESGEASTRTASFDRGCFLGSLS
jgi:hypothetical protein